MEIALIAFANAETVLIIRDYPQRRNVTRQVAPCVTKEHGTINTRVFRECGRESASAELSPRCSVNSTVNSKKGKSRPDGKRDLAPRLVRLVREND